jgi:signal transduction histidine kinase
MPATNPQTLELLLELGKLLSSKLELGELLTSILELTTQVVDSDSASLLLLDEKTQELYFDVALGLGEEASKVRLKLGQGIAGMVAESRKPEIINDVRKDPRWSSLMDERSGFKTISILAIPMVLKGKLIGVLEAINKRGGEFTASDQRAFEAFGSQAGIAIENARLFSSLKEERFKLSTVFSQMTNGAVLTDLGGRILLANEASVSCLGAGLSDIGSGFKEMSLTPSLTDLLATPAAAVDFTATRSEPTLLVLEGRMTRATMAGREGRLFMFGDRTESWRQERLKRTFLSLISHKLRTPLSAVTGFAEILNDEIDPAKDPLSAKAVQSIREQGAKVSELVEKLLSYTTIENAEAKINPCPVAIDEALEEAVDALAGKISARGATVNTIPTGLTVLGERHMIVEAFKNLIDNAIKFNPQPNPPVIIRVEKTGEWTKISFIDTGPGVPPEDQRRVFSGFHQVEKDFTGQQDGLGLGLAFVKKVAELHGGNVALASKIGAGATLTVTLPAGRAA